MYAMHQPQYVYAAPPVAPPPPRQFSGHGTSSAFSSSANPDEDWTQISDLAERRRIQNRIAQRNYRKKLKRRLEDLERRAGTSDGASSSSGAEKSTTASTGNSNSTRSSKAKSSAKKQQTQQQTPPAPVKPMPQGQFTPPMHPEDNLMFPHPYDERERSHTPPMFGYPTYPPPEEMMLAPYGATTAAPSYRPLTTEAYQGEWSTPVPVTLPSMTHFHDSMSYGFVPNMDMGATAYDSNPHTPPLSHSFDHSTSCSDSGYEYPTTPLSMPGSPGMTYPHH